MKLYELLQVANESVPSVELLMKSENMDLDTALVYRNRYLFLPNCSEFDKGGLTVRNIHRYYNVSRHSLLGLINFLRKPKENKSVGFIFASIDSDFFVLKNDGSIVFIDGYNSENVYYKCSRSEEMFYDALFVCIKLFSKQMRLEHIDDLWKNEVLSEAAQAAGGMEYFDFYNAYWG